MLKTCVQENCALLDYYAASSGNFLPTFRDLLSVPSSRVFKLFWPLKMGLICSPETSARICHYSLSNSAEERISHPLRGGSLKSRL